MNANPFTASHRPELVAMVAIIVAVALSVLAAPAASEGLPVIDFISPGGQVLDLVSSI